MEAKAHEVDGVRNSFLKLRVNEVQIDFKNLSSQTTFPETKRKDVIVNGI